MIRYLVAILIIFLLGFSASAFIFSQFFIPGPVLQSPETQNVPSPSDWIDKKDIQLYRDMVIININAASISDYNSTGSMEPTFGEKANGIRIKPTSANDVDVGDIVSFKSGENTFVHRVVEKGTDNEGIYFITKGDNNELRDEKIQFEDILHVTIGIIF